MKHCIASIIATLALATFASGQLVYNVVGDTGVKAQFTFTIDADANTVTVDIDNNILGSGGATGRITSFGFNAPFSDAALGENGSLVSFIEDADGIWNPFEPYELSGDGGIYLQVYGVGTGAGEEGGGSDPGIAYGDSATFVFTFPDFLADAVWGGEDSLTVRFQSIDNSLSGIEDDSDKVLGSPDDGSGGGSGSVPEPSTYGLLGTLALLGTMIVRQMHRR